MSLKEMIRGHVGKHMPAFIAVLSAALLAGCGTPCGPQKASLDIVFPNKWVGNIDKIELLIKRAM